MTERCYNCGETHNTDREHEACWSTPAGENPPPHTATPHGVVPARNN